MRPASASRLKYAEMNYIEMKCLMNVMLDPVPKVCISEKAE